MRAMEEHSTPAWPHPQTIEGRRRGLYCAKKEKAKGQSECANQGAFVAVCGCNPVEGELGILKSTAYCSAVILMLPIRWRWICSAAILD